MRIISIGDLVTDFYYKNGKLVGVNGGMTSHNIIANIANNIINTRPSITSVFLFFIFFNIYLSLSYIFHFII